MNASIRAEQAFILLACLFTTCLVISKVISAKYFLYIGYPVSCSNLIYPITFLTANIIVEVYGLRQARILVIQGFSINILVTIFIWIAHQLPTDATSPVSTSSFDSVFGHSLGLTIGSLVAYPIAQLLNLYLFEWIRELLNAKYLWLRSVIATLCAQLVGTALLVSILYLLEETSDSPTSVFNTFSSQYILRGLITLGGTPFVYIGSVLTHQWLGHKIVQ